MDMPITAIAPKHELLCLIEVEHVGANGHGGLHAECWTVFDSFIVVLVMELTRNTGVSVTNAAENIYRDVAARAARSYPCLTFQCWEAYQARSGGGALDPSIAEMKLQPNGEVTWTALSAWNGNRANRHLLLAHMTRQLLATIPQ